MAIHPAAALLDLKSLSVFSSLGTQSPLAELGKVLEAAAALRSAREGPDGPPVLAAGALISASAAWAALCGVLGGRPLGWVLAEQAALDENIFTLTAEGASSGRRPPPSTAAATSDLNRLGRLASLDLAAIGDDFGRALEDAGLAEAARDLRREASAAVSEPGPDAAGAGIHPAAAYLLDAGTDWGTAVEGFAAILRANGAGLLGAHRAFVWASDDAERRPGRGGSAASRQGWASGRLRPVLDPDPVRISDLSGYGRQRAVVVANTEAFLAGGGANNLLLYGDRGTGKSATVKAVCNEYADRGLRLVELRKAALPRFAELLEFLAPRKLRFVVFVDDLSFEATDDAYTDLKALLEGGAELRPDNVVVYATSNRRHLVKERFGERPASLAGDANAEVRAFDAMQEQLSLADRFGVAVVFAAPSQDEYLAIVSFLAEKRGLLDGNAAGRDALLSEALRWERWFNGRSPRTARQFVDWTAGGSAYPWEVDDA